MYVIIVWDEILFDLSCKTYSYEYDNNHNENKPGRKLLSDDV